MTESYLNAKIRHSDMASHFQRESVHTNPHIWLHTDPHTDGLLFLFLCNVCLLDIFFFLSVISDIITFQIFSTIENRLVLV